jgi:hypothetical protein
MGLDLGRSGTAFGFVIGAGVGVVAISEIGAGNRCGAAAIKIDKTRTIARRFTEQ